MKRIVVCCDGTWEWPGHRDEALSAPSNVAKIAEMVAPGDDDGVPQITFYQDGTAADLPEGETTLGLLLSCSIQEGYRLVAAHYTPGDEIWLFSFSRGAYTARSVVGMIRNGGLLRPEHLDKIPLAYELYRNRFPETHPDSGYAAGFRETFSVPGRIRFLGAWDTVGRLGVPDSILARFPSHAWNFHDVTLSSIVENAYHAVAIDERRPDYCPCLWQSGPGTGGEQVLFPGVHCDVGGGYHETGLSDCALAWMICKARTCGLRFSPEKLHLVPDPYGILHALEERAPEEAESERPLHGAISFSARARHEGPDYHPRNWPGTPIIQHCQNREGCCNYFRCH